MSTSQHHEPLTPAYLIRTLQLQPHPEGGWYRETFRDTAAAAVSNGQQRSASTMIYFLLSASDSEDGRNNHVSNLHRIDAAEAWHYYAGEGTVEVVELPSSRTRATLVGAGPAAPKIPRAGIKTEGEAKVTRLGLDFAAGERPQHLVPPGGWFGARLAEGSRWCLLGCTVAPGFEFAGFELAERARLVEEFPGCGEWILKLTRDV